MRLVAIALAGSNVTLAAWLSIASEALLQTNPTDKRTWFFIDELHNLKRLPKIETSLAEVRKFGGCFVIGTQMVSQLNAVDFVGKLGINDKDVLEKYSSIRDYLSLKFNCLKPITNCNCEISILEYKKNGVLFISCFNDRDATHTSKLIIDSCYLNDVLTVFSSKTLFKEKKNNIIDASEIKVSPEAKSTIISSVTAASKYTQTKKIFSEVLKNSCNENSYFVKIYGNEKIVRI